MATKSLNKARGAYKFCLASRRSRSFFFVGLLSASSCPFLVASSFIPSVTLRTAITQSSKWTSTYVHTTRKMAKIDDNNNDTIDVSNPLTELNLPSPLILGSGSFTRKLILKEMNIPFMLKVRPIDERNIGDRSIGADPKKLVLTLAKTKGQKLIEALLDPTVVTEEERLHPKLKWIQEHENREGTDDASECIVLTADQVVTQGQATETTILEKPDSIEQAKEFVRGYATSAPSTVGAVVMTHLPSMISVEGVDISTIRFKESVDATRSGTADECLVERLLEDGAPILSCAGGLMVEHPFVIEHIEGIDGTQDGVMGLSKNLVMNLLAELKVKLDDQRHSEAEQ